MPPANLHSVSVRPETYDRARAVAADNRVTMSEAIGCAMATFAKLPEAVREREIGLYLRERYERREAAVKS